MSTLYHHTVDIYSIDDSGTGDRMGRNQTQTLTASAVSCRVNEGMTRRMMTGGADIVEHSHRVHIFGYAKLDTTHQIWWTNPEGGSVIKMRVLGTKKAASPSMPYVIYCQAFQGGS